MKKKTFIAVIAAVAVLVAAAFLLSICWGSYKVSFFDIWQVLLGHGEKMQRTAILGIRMPRAILAMAVAAALAASGCILQTMTKNELADPGIIGINAGGAVAAVIFIQLQTAAYYSELGAASIFVLPFMAIIGSFLAARLFICFQAERGFVRGGCFWWELASMPD